MMATVSNSFKSNVMKDVFGKVDKAASSSRPIVLVGEFGSGKGWLARKIHQQSVRNQFSFTKVHCYALEHGQAGKRIFGHLSFTRNSARINRGAFEMANQGTLFFDGFDNLPKKIIEEVIYSVKTKQIHHVGSSNNITSDVRLITSFHSRSLKNIQHSRDSIENLFKMDPYIIRQPPLRKRREDIRPLIYAFLNNDLKEKDNQFTRHLDFKSKKISSQALYQCIKYTWPGNVRQLKNAIEHAAIISAGNCIRPEHLPLSIKLGQPDPGNYNFMEGSESFKRAERDLFLDVIEKTDSIPEAASLLDLDVHVFKEKFENSAHTLKDQSLEQ